MRTVEPIIVGVDGSEHSAVALAWALGEAELRRAEVRVLVVNDNPTRDRVVEEAVANVVNRFRARRPTAGITATIARGRPAAELIRSSARAQLVVLGARGRGAAAGMLLGSVSTKVATHAHCFECVAPRVRVEKSGLFFKMNYRPCNKFQPLLFQFHFGH